MFANNPRCVWSLCFDAANGCIMLHGNILHPLNICNVVDVTVLVNCMFRDGEFVREDRVLQFFGVITSYSIHYTKLYDMSDNFKD